MGFCNQCHSNGQSRDVCSHFVVVYRTCQSCASLYLYTLLLWAFKTIPGACLHSCSFSHPPEPPYYTTKPPASAMFAAYRDRQKYSHLVQSPEVKLACQYKSNWNMQSFSRSLCTWTATSNKKWFSSIWRNHGFITNKTQLNYFQEWAHQNEWDS